MGSLDANDMRASLEHPERFAPIFERHHSAMWAYLARLGGRQVADDLAGEVFVRAFERRATFDPAVGEVRSWLYGIATNLWRTRARSSARGALALARARSQEVLVPTSGEDDLVRALDAGRRCDDVLRALHRLDDSDRVIIVLFAWEELTYGEIGMALGVPIGTVRSRLSRARARLRELLEPVGEVSGDETDVKESP